VAPALEAAKIYEELFGQQDPDSIAFRADAGRISSLAGQSGVLETTMLGAMLLYEKKLPSPQAIAQKRAEIASLANALNEDWEKGRQEIAQTKIREYVKPFLVNPDRIRQRMPWILAQFGQYLCEKESLPGAGLAAATVGAKLADEILAPGHEDRQKTADLLKALQEKYGRSRL
jgi:hypothetical protein